MPQKKTHFTRAGRASLDAVFDVQGAAREGDGAGTVHAAGGYGPPGGGAGGGAPGGPPPAPPPGGGPPGYGPPPGGFGAPPPGYGYGPGYGPGGGPGIGDGRGPQTHPLAITSLVLGLLSLPLCCCGVLGLWAPIAAVACGVVGLGKIKEQPHVYKGDALCIVGIAAGGTGLVADIAEIAMHAGSIVRSRFGHV